MRYHNNRMNVHSDKAVFALAVIASECIPLLENARSDGAVPDEMYVKIVDNFNLALKELGKDWEINFRIDDVQ